MIREWPGALDKIKQDAGGSSPVPQPRNQEQMVAEVEGLHEAEKLVEKYLRNMTASQVKEEISYYRSTLSNSVPKMLSRAS
jgi:hypothetical protein